MKTFMNWSGGKDSALALYTSKAHGWPVHSLVTSINSSTNRISMHGVRRTLLQQQASAIGLPLHTIELPQMPDMLLYEDAVNNLHKQLKNQDYTHGIFGDIFLEDLKVYREKLLAQQQLECLFPLWEKDSKALLKTFVDDGFKAIIVCINSAYLDKSFCGRLLDESFINDLPDNVDPCGENGEYHSFVFDGPVFSAPISFETGEVIYKEYAAPKSSNDCFTTPQLPAGFFFQDIIPQ